VIKKSEVFPPQPLFHELFIRVNDIKHAIVKDKMTLSEKIKRGSNGEYKWWPTSLKQYPVALKGSRRSYYLNFFSSLHFECIQLIYI
jgi:hypothetical protein